MKKKKDQMKNREEDNPSWCGGWKSGRNWEKKESYLVREGGKNLEGAQKNKKRSREFALYEGRWGPKKGKKQTREARPEKKTPWEIRGRSCRKRRKNFPTRPVASGIRKDGMEGDRGVVLSRKKSLKKKHKSVGVKIEI